MTEPKKDATALMPPDPHALEPYPYKSDEPKKKIFPQSFALREQKISHWYAEAAPGVTIGQMMVPEYWANVLTKQVKPQDLLTIVAEDGSFRAEAFFRAVSSKSAVIEVTYYKNLRESSIHVVPDVELEIVWRSPNTKYSVIRKSDKAVLKEGMTTEDEAMQYIKDYRKSLAK